MTFFFFACQLSAPHYDRVYFEVRILGQGIICKFFVRYIMTGCIFLCAERIATGSGFQTPAAPPVHLKVECPPPPPGFT